MEVMEQRRNEIVAFVNEQGQVSFSQLKEKFPTVSEMTLRTDLKILDQNQQLVRIHGGAKSLVEVVGTEDFLKLRFVRNTEDKKIIAHKAKQLIKGNQTIFLDSGSTTTMLATEFEDKPNVIMTSGLTCAMELAKLKESRVVMLGGNMNCRSMSVNGYNAIRAIEKVNFDIAFMGVTRFDYETGFTCETLEDAEIKRLAVEKSNKVVVLMDSSKIGKRGTYTMCNLDQVDVVVCDDKIPENFIEECKARGILVY